MKLFLSLNNAAAFALDAVPRLPLAEFRAEVCGIIDAGARLVALTAIPLDGAPHLFAVLADTATRRLLAAAAPVDKKYPALTNDCPAAHLFEREIFEETGIKPLGHPWLKPVRLAAPGRAIGDLDFLDANNAGLHQVGVGPVHAGVIEPGHFRFTCDGEKILHVEIALGYQHRGAVKKLLAAPPLTRLKLCETLAGDTTIAHTTAYAQIIETLAAAPISPGAAYWRAIALELERLANHIGDLGALSGDVGFLPTASFCGRLRGDILNSTALLCGNRFGRNLIAPTGVLITPDPATIDTLETRIAKSERECTAAVELLLDTPSVLARFDDAGYVSRELAGQFGAVGVVARGAGVKTDVRADFSASPLYENYMPALGRTGDVNARAHVRWKECKRSFGFLRRWLREVAALPSETPAPAPRNSDGNGASNQGVVSLVEGWRGEVAHYGFTDASGKLAAYKIIDPSFHNWMVLAQALRGEEISNFPLCNKSFNLSYCGVDL